MAADAEEFAILLDEGAPRGGLPQRLLELAALAAEVADALTAPMLTRAERERIEARVTVLMGRRRRLLADLDELRRRRALLAGAAGGAAALGLTMLGLALLRRSQAGSGAAAA